MPVENTLFKAATLALCLGFAASSANALCVVVEEGGELVWLQPGNCLHAGTQEQFDDSVGDNGRGTDASKGVFQPDLNDRVAAAMQVTNGGGGALPGGLYMVAVDNFQHYRGRISGFSCS